ncbi:DNA polymerase III subunit delta [bacterium]|nr:DNA polymerase III subunit delta [bacterium]
MADNKNIFLLTGEEVERERFIEELIDKYLPPELREFNLDIFSGGDVSLSEILQKMNTLPFLSQYRVVILKDPEKIPKINSRVIMELLDKNPPTTILVLSLKDKSELPLTSKEEAELKQRVIEKNFTLPVRKKDAINAKKEWIIKEVKRKGGEIDKDAASALAELSLDFRQLEEEIEKLLLYAEGKTVTKEDVQTLVTSSEDVKLYELTDAIFEGKDLEAMRYLHSIMETADIWMPLIIIHNLANHTRILIQTKLLQERNIPLTLPERIPPSKGEILNSLRKYLLEGDDNIFQVLKKRGFLAKKWQEQAMRFSKLSLYNILRILHRLDIEIKGGADPWERLEWFIFKVAGEPRLRKSVQAEERSL